MVTMVTIPKSDGVSSRARMTTDPIRTAKLASRTSNGRPGTANCGPAKSLARGDRAEGAVGLERFQLVLLLAIYLRVIV